MNNKLNEIQEMLINQMKRLDNNEIMKEDAKVTEWHKLKSLKINGSISNDICMKNITMWN